MKNQSSLTTTSGSTPKRPLWVRILLALLCPPCAIVLMWRRPGGRWWLKALGSIGLLLYSLLYAGAILGLLVLVGVLEIEWRGGFGPSIVFRKTAPDYGALEDSRSRQKALPPRETKPAAPAKPYWTQFRGPQGDGAYDEGPILTAWPPAGPQLLWRSPVGGGYASFAIAEGRAFTIEQRRDQEAVAAYDLETGKELWAYAYPGLFTEWMGGEGPRATPAYHDSRVYSLGALGDFCCLDAATGKLIWRKNILQESQTSNLRYGLAASPIVVDDKIILLGGQAKPGNSILAYDRLTGNKVWSAFDDKQAYATPLVLTLAGQRQLLITTAGRAVGVTVEDGRLLWEFPWSVQYANSIAAPIVVDSNRFVLSGGYGVGCAMVEVSRSDLGFSARALWRNKNLRNKFNPSVIWQGHIYGLDEGVLACIEARTGERKWRKGNYGYGQLLLANGCLIILGGEGELALVKAAPESHQELGRVQALKGKTWNVPALAHGRLLVRNSVEMACYDLRPR